MELLKAAELADAQAMRLEAWSRREGDLTTFAKTSSDDSKHKQRGNGSTNSQLTCAYCKKSGHTIAFCKHPKCSNSKKNSNSAVSSSSS